MMGVDEVVGDAGGDTGQTRYHGHELEEYETHGHAVYGLYTEPLAQYDESCNQQQYVNRELGVGYRYAVDTVMDYRCQTRYAASSDLMWVEECHPAADENSQAEGHDGIFFEVF